MARIVELIYTTDKRGNGVEGDPVRNVEQWFSKNGELIFEFDPCEYELYAMKELSIEDSKL